MNISVILIDIDTKMEIVNLKRCVCVRYKNLY